MNDSLNSFGLASHPPRGIRVLLVYSYLTGRRKLHRYVDCQVIVSAGDGCWMGSDGKHLRNHHGDWMGWLPLPSAVPESPEARLLAGELVEPAS